MKVYAISVDKPAETKPWVEKKGLTMPMLSDPDMKVIEDLFHIRNPREPELAIHAVYLLDRDGRVYYRKVGRARPYSREFLTAIDWHKAHPGRKPATPAPKKKAPAKKAKP